jgi:hypothetical protein
MPVDLRINMEGGGSVPLRVFNDPAHEDFEVDLPDLPTSVTVDPDNWILKTATSSLYGLNITTTDLPEAQEGDSVSMSLRGRGGQPPYVWTTQGAPPLGLALDPATGVLSGTAPDSGLYIFHVSLADHSGGSDTQLLHWNVRPEPPDTTVVPTPGPLALKITPSPARQYASFELRGPLDAQVALTIFELSGRRVRRLWNGMIPARAIPWDGRDDRGRDVASGVYLCRLTGPGDAVTRRLVWIR